MNHSRWTIILALLAVACAWQYLATPLAVAADDDAPGKTIEKPSAEQIRGWVKGLDDEAFATRKQAADRLLEAGLDAVAPLTDAAQGDSLEVTLKSVEILSKMMAGKDAAAAGAARAAMEKFAQSDRKQLADRAAAALKPPAQSSVESPAAPNPVGKIIPRGPRHGGIIVGGPGGIILGPGVVIKGHVRMESVSDGNRTIEIRNDDDVIRITESKDSIKVSTTKMVDGKEKTETFEAKDADELKAKQPEAYKLYEQNAKAGGNGGIRITAGAPVPGGPAQAEVEAQINAIEAKVKAGTEVAKAKDDAVRAIAEAKARVDAEAAKARDIEAKGRADAAKAVKIQASAERARLKAAMSSTQASLEYLKHVAERADDEKIRQSAEKLGQALKSLEEAIKTIDD